VKIKSGFIVSGLGVAADEPNNKWEKIYSMTIYRC